MRTSVPIDRALSKLGLASRTEARVLIRQGRVRANGRLIEHVGERVKLDAKISISGARVHGSTGAQVHGSTGEPVPGERVRGERVRGAQVSGRRVVIAFNKPRGVVTTTKDPEGRPTVFDVLDEHGMTERLHAIGRLDLASTGLLLLTNDSVLLNTLTDPVNGVLRKYAVVVRGRVSEEAAAGLAAHHVEIRKASGPETHLLVTLTQGKNREIRNMFDEIGHEVTRLHRVEFGPVSLGKLQPGNWVDVSDVFLEKVAAVLT
jgi:23S rRNA pseudouridine2605 synthase